MQNEKIICQNCQNGFVIEPEDFVFYEKMKVPPPTFCPDCRRQRRLFFRNEWVLYKRKCNAPGHSEEIVSVFSQDKPITVYDEKYWWSDAWDPLEYGRDYDFEKTFFEQYKQLLRKVPLIALSTTNMVNCNYCNVAEGDKDCFFTFASAKDENVSYANKVIYCKDSQDLYIVNGGEVSYELVNCNHCYKTIFSQNCNQCMESAFLFNCHNCDHCFCSVNLRNKSYCILNHQYSKADYEKRLKEYDLGSWETILQLKGELHNLKEKLPHRFANILKSVGVTGDNVIGAKNSKQIFDILGTPSVEDSKFLNWGGEGAKDAYDSGPGCGFGFEQGYETTDTGLQASRTFFTSVVYGSFDIYYSINCHGSNNLFGCYGLRNKEYCILNKQYTKQEYLALVPKIIKHMNDAPYVDKKRRVYKYGEFFPAEVSPYAYNEIIAQDHFPLSKEQALSQGYSWKDQDQRGYKITVQPAELPDNIKNVGDDILGAVIGCAHGGTCTDQCTTAFKIMPHELKFYRKMNLPLPRLCFNCRHNERLRQRNPLNLWHKKCQCAGQKSENGVYKNTVAHSHGVNSCTNEFETSYPPESKEVVYCEQCYQQEVM